MPDYSSFPYVSQATTDAEYSELFQTLQRTGVVGTLGDTSLKGTADGTDMDTSISVGQALILGFFFDNPSAESLTHDSSTANPRIDRVVLRLDLTAAIGDRIIPAILKGTPAASNPTAPALTQVAGGVWEIPLYRVNVDGGVSTITPDKVFDERRFLGQQLGQWTTATRPDPPMKYDAGMNETLGYWEFYDGTTWKKLWNGVAWGDIAGKPTTSTLDGRTLFVSDNSPGSGDGVNGDLWAEY